MKSFKQYLKESEEVKELDEAKMDWGNVMNEVTNSGLLVDIINRHTNPEIRVGQKSYPIKDAVAPASLESIRKRFGNVGKLTDEQSDLLVKEEIEFENMLKKMEKDVQNDMIKITKKYEEEIKKVLKKYNAIV